MMSSRELWNIMTGRSCLTDPEAVKIELNQAGDFIFNGLDSFKLPNSTSEEKVKASAVVKRKEFIIELSKLLNLDEWSTHELFQNFLRLEFKGSGPQFQAIIKHPVQLQGFSLKVLEFYFKERSFLLKCIKHLIINWQNELCLFHSSFSKMVERFISDGFIKKIIKQLHDLCKQLCTHEGNKTNSKALGMLAQQILKEQCELVEIILFYYKDFEMTSSIFLDLAKLFRRQHFGMSQVNRKHIISDGQVWMKQFGYLSSMVLLQGLDLEAAQNNLNKQTISHHLLTNEEWKVIDELLISWDDTQYQGPVLIGWTIFRHICLSKDEQKLTRHFGDAALRCNLLPFILEILNYPIFIKLNEPLAGYVKSMIYVLVNLLLKIFQEDSLPDYQILTPIVCKVLSEPALSSLFFLEESKYGMHILFDSARMQFPFLFCPFLNFLSSLCTDKANVDLVYEVFENQFIFAELFGKNTESEITCVGKIWKRLSDRIIFCDSVNEKFILPADINGKITLHKQDSRMICWTYTYSGWRFLFFLINEIVDNIHLFSSDSGEDGLLVVLSVVQLIEKVLKHTPDKMDEFEPLVVGVLKLTKRLCFFEEPPSDLLAVCISCIHNVGIYHPIEMFKELCNTNFLLQEKFVFNEFNATHGRFEKILATVEQVNGKFELTIEYLNFIQMFVSNAMGHSDVAQVYIDVIVNVSFILREIFSKFAKWLYKNAETKTAIGLKCLSLVHTILSPTFKDYMVNEKNFKGTLKQMVLQELFYQQAGSSFLLIVTIGCVEIENITFSSQNTNIVQMVKLSLSVLEKLLNFRLKEENISSLEETLSSQFVLKLSDIDFVETTTKVSMFTVIAKYIYHQEDPKLPILAVLVLHALAEKFPLLMTANLGESLDGLRNAFVNRLSGRVEAIRLKVAILEFLTVCVEKQPGLVEAFLHLISGKEFGQFSCVLPILNILSDTNHLDVLTSSSMSFLSALWLNRYDKAMTLIKKSKDFWCNVTFHLTSNFKQITKPMVDTALHALNILAIETYYVKGELFDEELKVQLKKLSDGKAYLEITKMLFPDESDDETYKLNLAKTWKMYLSVLTETQADVCGLNNSIVVEQIFSELLLCFDSWNSSAKNVQILEELSSLLLVLFNKWKEKLVEYNKHVEILADIMEGLSESIFDGEAVSTVFINLFAMASKFLQCISSKKYDQIVLNRFLKLSCNQLAYIRLQHPKLGEALYKDLSYCVLSLLNEVMLKSNDILSCLTILSESSTVQALEDLINIKLSASDLKFVEVALMFLFTVAQTENGAKHLGANNIGTFLCLNIKHLYSSLEANRNYSVFYNSWSTCLLIMSHTLKFLKYSFLQSAIDFLGGHKEILFSSLDILTQVNFEDRLLITEQTTLFICELSHYQPQVVFALNDVFNTFKFGIVQACQHSIALLSRPKLINHLLNSKLLENTKMASPLSLRNENLRSFATDNEEKYSPNSLLLQTRLINIVRNCLSAMRCLTPHVVQCIFDEGMDIGCFSPLFDIGISSPSLDSIPSFGTLLACLNTSIKLIQKLVQVGSDQTPEKDISFAVGDEEYRKSLLWYIIDNSLIVILSQACCYLRMSSVDERSKHFLRRELGTELSNFLYAVNRFKSRRGVPPSPINTDKTGQLRRSPSKMISLIDENESSLFKLVDIFSKQLLR
nr:nucleoporin NUP188 [Hydra vulgaris]